MKAVEARSMAEPELEQAVENARHEIFNLRFQGATGRMSNTSRLRAVRHDLARLLTVKRERAMWAAYDAAAGKEE